MKKESKLHFHFITALGGSIGELSSDFLESLYDNFIVTRDWMNEIPYKREILFCHFLNVDVMLNPEFDTFKFKVLVQPIDGTDILSEIVDSLNRFDLIITPANAGKEIMKSNGVRAKIEVIPNFYKSDLFWPPVKYKELAQHVPQNKIIFYHESSFHPRKGIDILYEGFIKAFADTKWANMVVLLVKDLPFNKITYKRNEVLKKKAIKLQKQYKNPPSIEKLSCFLSDEELKYLWCKTDIYVSMAKIEGFGIPLLRMLLLKKPIIALKNNLSGYSDYLNNENSYLIPTEIKEAKDEFMWLYKKTTKWGEPRMNDVVEMFKTVLEDYLTGNPKVLKNDSVVANKYSLSTVMSSYYDVICKEYKNIL